MIKFILSLAIKVHRDGTSKIYKPSSPCLHIHIHTQQYTYTNTARQEHGTTGARQEHDSGTTGARQWHDRSTTRQRGSISQIESDHVHILTVVSRAPVRLPWKPRGDHCGGQDCKLSTHSSLFIQLFF